MTRNNLFIGAIIAAAMLLVTVSSDNLAYASVTHEVELSAETTVNGQLAYTVTGYSSDGLDQMSKFTAFDGKPSIPGPTITIEQGDIVQITLLKNGLPVELDVPGIADTNPNVDIYEFQIDTPGTYIYQDKNTQNALLGMFGIILVNPTDGKLQYVEQNVGIVDDDISNVKKDFVMAMIGSTFWGQEIDSDGNQTPLWINPLLGAKQNDLVRFHILSIGMDHTFHLHAHKWVDPGTTSIIDAKLLQSDSSTHSFAVKAGESGVGFWQYHCHIFAHMESGMHGSFQVGINDVASIPGKSSNVAHDAFGIPNVAVDVATFTVSDEPGTWFKSARGEALAPITVSESLEVVLPDSDVNFIMTDTSTRHTITSLIYPEGATHMPFDQVASYSGGATIKLHDPGLYVFSCKVHPYMFGTVIVQDPLDLPGGENEPGITLGERITTVNGIAVPTASDLALRLLKVFFVATTPDNWQTFATTDTTWNPQYPALPVVVYTNDGDRLVVNLSDTIHAYFGDENQTLQAVSDPEISGVGEVWVNTQFEHTQNKAKPGTATAVNTADWTVTKKVSLPEIHMNNPHNMWTDRNQSVIYQTEWFDTNLTVFDRESGELVDRIHVGDSPAHVMTRADNDDIHVTLNGENGVVEILPGTDSVNRIIPTQGPDGDPTHPHAHWMSSDGKFMVTPNVFTDDSTLLHYPQGKLMAKINVGSHPIATGMTPDDSHYVTANFLDSTLSVISIDDKTKVTDIQLLADYVPTGGLTGLIPGGDPLPSLLGSPEGAAVMIGALPIQTPISPSLDAPAIVTANTLSGTLTIVDMKDPSNPVPVKTLACDPGCHGVNFGAKEGDGYYAYVSSKFSNRMLVVDMDPNNDNNLDDARIAGSILLVDPTVSVSDDVIVSNPGMGGQGVLAIPNIYQGWIQKTIAECSSPGACSDEINDYLANLTDEQKNLN